jgi:hypothetical protein
MPPEVILVFFGTLLGFGSIILLGQRMQYRHKERLLEAGDSGEVRELRRAVEELQEEVQALRDGATDFDERLEFTERLLARPSAGGETSG